jgi:hypothetical protein
VGSSLSLRVWQPRNARFALASRVEG